LFCGPPGGYANPLKASKPERRHPGVNVSERFYGGLPKKAMDIIGANCGTIDRRPSARTRRRARGNHIPGGGR